MDEGIKSYQKLVDLDPDDDILQNPLQMGQHAGKELDAELDQQAQEENTREFYFPRQFSGHRSAVWTIRIKSLNIVPNNPRSTVA